MEAENHTDVLQNGTLKRPKPKTIFTEYGNEIEQIISHKPPSFVRWGTVYFGLILLCIVAISWFVKYPDIVVAKAKLNSLNAPKAVVARTEGKIVSILAKEAQEVKAGQVLGYMESIADPESIREIGKNIDSMISLIQQDRTDEVVRYFPASVNYLNAQGQGNLGELQSAYQDFMQSFIAFRDYISSGFYIKRKHMLQEDMNNIQKLQKVLLAQKDLLEQDVSLSNENFSASEVLANEKVISPMDYRNEKSKLISRKLSLPLINASILSNESSRHEKLKEILELENLIVVQKNSFIQALQTIKSQRLEWEARYFLKAPVSGTVFFAGFLQENQEVRLGQPLFYVHPANTSYFIEMLVPQYNFGKVREGQQVLLKFDAYPFEQNGLLVGHIDYINRSGTDSGYLVKVNLANGLSTNFNKPIQYRYGLKAEANIVTGDLRLLQRFYYNISRQMSR